MPILPPGIKPPAPTLEIGIGLYKSTGTNLIWKLLYHPTIHDGICPQCPWTARGTDSRLKLSFLFQHAVWSFELSLENFDKWVHKSSGPSHIRLDENLQGIIHVGQIKGEIAEFTKFVEKLGPEKKGDNPSKLNVWGPAPYVIRILAYLDKDVERRSANGIKLLNCINGNLSYTRLHPVIERRIYFLRKTEKEFMDMAKVIPL